MLLGGKTHIIVFELAKLSAIIEKPIDEMTKQERWAVFFKYTADKGKRHLVNEVLEREEGIAMAGSLLQTLSADDHERARLLTEYKIEVDYQSGMVGARRDGLAEGHEKGLAEGLEKGLAKGQEETQLEIAKEMLLDGDNIEKIARITKLDPEKIRQLQT